jgi:hypothetical protein
MSRRKINVRIKGIRRGIWGEERGAVDGRGA